MAEKFSYEKAKNELDKILAELEDGDTGIDSMAKHIKRAGELIAICREKLRDTENEVQKVLKDIEKEEPRS